MFDFVLYVAFPYVAVFLAIVVGVLRYSTDRFSYTSLSSQFLESRWLFWGSVPWHYGIVIILLAHNLAALFPQAWALLIGEQTRLYILEVTGIALAFLALFGLVALLIRRMTNARIRVVTSRMDVVLLAVLVVQVALGATVALFYRWGSEWYLYTAVPWLWSLATLQPRTEYVAALPLLVRLHMLGGFLVIGLIPFTRLVHLLTWPVTYLWRPYQVVRWYRRPVRRQPA